MFCVYKERSDGPTFQFRYLQAMYHIELSFKGEKGKQLTKFHKKHDYVRLQRKRNAGSSVMELDTCIDFDHILGPTM